MRELREAEVKKMKLKNEQLHAKKPGGEKKCGECWRGRECSV